MGFYEYNIQSCVRMTEEQTRFDGERGKIPACGGYPTLDWLLLINTNSLVTADSVLNTLTKPLVRDAEEP